MNDLRKIKYNVFWGYLIMMIARWTVWVIVNITYYVSLSMSELKRALIADFAEAAFEAILLYTFCFISGKLLTHHIRSHSDNEKSLVAGMISHVLASAIFALGLALFYNLLFPGEKIFFYHVLLSDFFVLVIFSTTNISMALVNKSKKEEKDRRNAEATARKNEILALQTKLEMLSLQTNNHFIFNSFSTATGLIRHDPPKAEAFINNLSSMYRYMTQNSNKHIVPLNEEVDFVENYIQLLKNRYSGLTVIVSTELRSIHAFVPPAAIQSLIENAVKHNVHGSENPLVVNVNLNDEYIVVSNRVIKRSDEVTGTHSGLDNLKKRYLLLTEKHLKVDSDGQTFNVSLPLIFEEDLSYESFTN